MKKAISLLLAIALTLYAAVSAGASHAPQVSARSAVVLCAGSRSLLYAVNEQEQLSMASTTKIMTAVLALETNRTDMTVCVGQEVCGVEGTSLGLRPGDEMTLYDLVTAMLLTSGNDAANAVAAAVGGSVEAFVRMMNEKARELQMTRSGFATPSGLDAETHYSTALDMALLAEYAMRLPLFRDIVSRYRASVYINGEEIFLTNHNRFLTMYDGAVGIKTGFTKKSGRCLVTAAERNGVMLIAVTLRAPNDWADHAALFDYGFSRVNTFSAAPAGQTYHVDVVGGTQDKIACSTREPIVYTAAQALEGCRTVVRLEPFVYAPLRPDTPIGTLSCYKDGILLGVAPILTDSGVEMFFSERVIPFREKWMNFWNGWFSDG